jgi:hypothetical protein
MAASIDDPHQCLDYEVGVEIWGVYDGVLYWQCQRCQHRRHRFPEGTRQHRLAMKYVPLPDR